MISSKNSLVRRRLTPQQRQKLLARFHRSQLTQRDFANRHRIGLSTLTKWLRCEEKTALPRVKFQEIAPPHTPLRYPVEVVSPQGWTVRLQNTYDIESLPQLLQTLPC
jgi:transposase-like protein